ncbi:hypothetical protein [Chryseobacterium indologenes]|uniref:hypothetical protein n=1 Tax=Chryseobacterium indologenes TaxID=253 RepID=UPI001BCF5A95|nr:hypothetical protein [Chryseobacterium indologenes]
MYKSISFILLFFFMFSCKPENVKAKEFKIGKVSFNYPSDWKLIEPKMIDSYSAYLTNNEDTIFINYGRYNHKIYKNKLSENLREQIEINGREAVIEIPNSKQGFYNIYVPKLDSLDGVIISSSSLKDRKKVATILSGFKIDNIGNSNILDKKNFSNKNKETGLTNYEYNCLSCHSENNRVIGRSLDKAFINSKSSEWLTNYLYSDKKSYYTDIKCFQFDKKDSILVNQMVNYLKHK